MYAQAGVDIAAGDRAVALIRERAKSTHGPAVLGGIGAFAGLYALSGYREPVLVSSTDGVGTKLKIAIELGRFESIGRDLVNLCINDVLTTGATPLFFLDYVAVGRLVPERLDELIGGMASACREAGCALIGGETAEMRDVYADEDFDLAGFIVGVVERHRLVDGTAVAQGDDVWALPSSGLHTNGYALARQVLARRSLGEMVPELGRSLGEELLETHRSYQAAVGPAIERGIVRAMAHITGGGLPGNLARTIPADLAAEVEWGSWPVPDIFRLIQEEGGVSRSEMLRVFNMGVGFTLICAPASGEAVRALVPGALRIGRVVPASGSDRVIVRGLS